MNQTDDRPYAKVKVHYPCCGNPFPEDYHYFCCGGSEYAHFECCPYEVQEQDGHTWCTRTGWTHCPHCHAPLKANTWLRIALSRSQGPDDCEAPRIPSITRMLELLEAGRIVNVKYWPGELWERNAPDFANAWDPKCYHWDEVKR